MEMKERRAWKRAGTFDSNSRNHNTQKLIAESVTREAWRSEQKEDEPNENNVEEEDNSNVVPNGGDSRTACNDDNDDEDGDEGWGRLLNDAQSSALPDDRPKTAHASRSGLRQMALMSSSRGLSLSKV